MTSLQSRTLLVVALSLLLPTSASAANTDKPSKQGVVGTWSNIDPFADQKIDAPLIEQKAFEIDLQGNKKEVPLLPDKILSGDIDAEYFTDGFYQYYYSHYEPWNATTDNYHFFIGSMTYENVSGNSQSMTYQQMQSHTSTWTTVGKLGTEVGLELAVIGNAKFTAGFELSKSTTTSSSYTYTGAATISPYSTGTLALYDAGHASSGQGVWKKYTPSGTQVGAYAETSGAWMVATNKKSFRYSEYRNTSGY